MRIKWPNDIYFGSKDKKVKIGGVLINSYAIGDTVTALIGMLRVSYMHHVAYTM